MNCGIHMGKYRCMPSCWGPIVCWTVLCCAVLAYEACGRLGAHNTGGILKTPIAQPPPPMDQITVHIHSYLFVFIPEKPTVSPSGPSVTSPCVNTPFITRAR
ncbi:hypothetical protein QC762_0093900 [Podospora pseudocomata]|uniref:Secreted protein n=1 Tax=Podospora pseudocomata TaxID=2093779 RepID=A0ABR0G713_9PEZI|nr:hypothetical protein QC762_0093900 [Podospora pseudocomata]